MSDSRPPCTQAAGSVSCRDCAEFLMDYLEGLLPQEEQAKFESHLALCPDCLIYLENYRKAAAMAAACRDCPPDPSCTSIPNRLVDAILAARKTPKDD